MPRQKKFLFCRDKTFVATNTGRDKHMLVATNKNIILSRQKSILLSRQKRCFVVTNTCLSRQTSVCRDKTFVATKMILVAAPANDSLARPSCSAKAPLKHLSHTERETVPDGRTNKKIRRVVQKQNLQLQSLIRDSCNSCRPSLLQPLLPPSRRQPRGLISRQITRCQTHSPTSTTVPAVSITRQRRQQQQQQHDTEPLTERKPTHPQVHETTLSQLMDVSIMLWRVWVCVWRW